MEFKLEVLGECLEEMKPLLEEHYHEVAMYQDKINLNPDYDRYYQIEGQGNLVIYTARDNSRLVGYAVFFIDEHLHYRDTVYAVNDVVYIDPEYRHTEHTVEFFKFIEQELKKEVHVITYHMKTFKTFESLMDHLDYDKAEFLFSKYIWQ